MSCILSRPLAAELWRQAGTILYISDPLTPHRSTTPWVNGEPLEGVTLPYNCRVEIVAGPRAGQTGWLVAVGDLGADPLYTVELESRDPDAEVRQSMLRRTA